MIDTLKLNLEDCEINSKAQIIVEPSPYVYDSQQRFINYDLFLDNSTGELVTGKKAYLNTSKYNLTIKPKYKLETDEINKKFMYDRKFNGGMIAGRIQNIKVESEKFNAGVYVQTSLPRYMNETNFNSIPIVEQKKVLNKLEKDLRESGIKTNIWNSNLSRLDLFANIETDENFSNYAEIFSMINLTRMSRFEYAGTTFLYKNGEQQICCYDKIYEIENKHKSVKEFKMPVHPPNVMRIENRLLKKRKIMDVIGFYKLGELYKNFDLVRDHYKKEIGKNIFNYKPKEIEIRTSKSIKEEMELYWQQSNRKWFDNFCRVKGLEYLLKLSSIESLFEAVDMLEMFNRMQKSRIKKKIQQVKMDLDMLRMSRTDKMKSNSDLYKELKLKFYKAVA